MSPARDPKRYMRDRRAANPRLQLGDTLQQLYGLSLAGYDQLLSQQGGVCAVCLRPPTGRRLCVDHDHDTGVVRALLCNRCNTALGIMEENPDLLWKLLDYAEHCLEAREWFAAHPIRFAVAQAYKQSADLPERRKACLEAMQRLRNRPVAEVMGGRRGRILAKMLEDLAAPIASLPEIAAVRAGAVQDAVYV